MTTMTAVSTRTVGPIVVLLAAGCTAGAGVNPPLPGGDEAGLDQSGVTAPLVRIEQLDPGDECAAGGVTIRAGVDADSDGALGDSEVEESFVVCNGPAGTEGATGSKGDAGEAGPAGAPGEAGPKGDAGETGAPGERGDQGLPGDPGEQGERGEQGPEGDRGAQGDAGEQGEDGLKALIRLDVEPRGEVCPTGGVWVLVGLDVNRDDLLSDDEVTDREVICHGLRGPAGNGEGGGPGVLIRLTELDPGAACAAGGTRIEAGPDLDGDGSLDDDEVDQSATLCNGSLCESPLWHDGGDGGCVPIGTCLEGYHDGGDGSCVPLGECIEGMRDGGDGSCVPDGECAPDFRLDPLGGDGCVPACDEDEHDDGQGHCVPLGECADGFHDGGDGRCVPVGTCLEGFRDGGNGTCVPLGECARRYVDVNGVCVQNQEIFYEFDDHTFTNCGQTGPTGPSVDQCRGAYQAAQWSADDELFDVVAGIQLWTVPEGGIYRIEARGARGGGNGGSGAIIAGEFELEIGEVLQIMVGQQGTAAPAEVGNGGGGGTFVITEGENPLIIAGGGAGTGHNQARGNGANYHGRVEPAGNEGTGGNHGLGGVDGNGGAAGFTTGNPSVPNGGGGGGLLTDGGGQGAANGGQAFVNGGVGGDSTGGFGGGGGSNVFIYGCGRSPHGGSGGGGFSGGGGGGTNCNGIGGGGGSFNAGANPQNQPGAHAGHGQVIIRSLLQD